MKLMSIGEVEGRAFQEFCAWLLRDKRRRGFGGSMACGLCFRHKVIEKIGKGFTLGHEAFLLRPRMRLQAQVITGVNTNFQVSHFLIAALFVLLSDIGAALVVEKLDVKRCIEVALLYRQGIFVEHGAT